MNTVSIEIFVGKWVSVLFKLKKTAFSKKTGMRLFPSDKKDAASSVSPGPHNRRCGKCA